MGKLALLCTHVITCFNMPTAGWLNRNYPFYESHFLSFQSTVKNIPHLYALFYLLLYNLSNGIQLDLLCLTLILAEDSKGQTTHKLIPIISGTTHSVIILKLLPTFQALIFIFQCVLAVTGRHMEG
jgi:hypothetical protein